MLHMQRQQHHTLSRRDLLHVLSFGVIGYALSPHIHAYADESAKVSIQQAHDSIAQRFEQIRSTYSPGEVLSPDDELFVLSHATSQHIRPDGLGGNASFNFNAYGSDVSVNASGYAYHNGTFNYTYGADVSVSRIYGGTPRWMEFAVTCDAYGVGQNGATTFQGSHSCKHSVSNQDSFYANLVDGYSGITAYWNLTLRLSGSSASGNYFSAVY